MIKKCPNCKRTNLKLLFNLPNQQGSSYWTCLQCSWQKLIPWWRRKAYQKLEKKRERVEAIQLAARIALDPFTYLSVDPAVEKDENK